jgi:hypothetical protein
VRDSSQEDFVVDDGVEDSSTVLLIQFEEQTMDMGILALDTQKGPGSDGTSTDSEKDWGGCERAACYFV